MSDVRLPGVAAREAAERMQGLVGVGGFLAPASYADLEHTRRYGFFKVYTHREPWYWRPLLWLFRMPRTWQEVEFCPPAPRLRDVLPSFSATRGGIRIP